MIYILVSGHVSCWVLEVFLSPRSIGQKNLIPKDDLEKNFGTPNTKLKRAQEVFIIVFVPLTLNKKNPKSLTVFLYYV